MQTRTTKMTISLDATSPDKKVLMLNGSPAIQRYAYNESRRGSIFLNENMLLFVVEGTITIKYGQAEYKVCKNEMVFLKKDILIEYQTRGVQSNSPVGDEYILVSLKYELVKEFAKLAELPVTAKEEITAISVNTSDKRLLRYIASLETYFAETEKVKGSLLKIKLLELLFYLAGSSAKILGQVLDIRENFRSDITATVEENTMNSLSLNQLAVLAGRSLSSFRRDFLAIYNMPPSKWIRQKRLEKAHELLLSTTMTVTDICYTTGFDNIAHFSRLFKSQFGNPPSEYRANFLVA